MEKRYLVCVMPEFMEMFEEQGLTKFMEDGEKGRFYCDSIDTAGAFLLMNVIFPDSDGVILELQIPYHTVFYILSAKDMAFLEKRIPGFSVPSKDTDRKRRDSR